MCESYKDNVNAFKNLMDIVGLSADMLPKLGVLFSGYYVNAEGSRCLEKIDAENQYFAILLAKIGFDAAKNEQSKILKLLIC